jgi:hypothetical protein
VRNAKVLGVENIDAYIVNLSKVLGWKLAVSIGVS